MGNPRFMISSSSSSSSSSSNDRRQEQGFAGPLMSLLSQGITTEGRTQQPRLSEEMPRMVMLNPGERVVRSEEGMGRAVVWPAPYRQ